MAVNTLDYEIGAYQNLVRTPPALIAHTLLRQTLCVSVEGGGKHLWRLPARECNFFRSSSRRIERDISSSRTHLFTIE